MIKKVINKILPFAVQSRIRRVLAEIRRIKSHKGKIITQYSYDLISKKGWNTFFGYYEIPPFNSRNDLIFLRTKEKGKAYIFLKDNKTGVETLVGSTLTWNWQQGCRLRWFPNSDVKIIFNDLYNNHYVTRIVDTITHEEKMLDTPLYDISHNGEIGISINFGLLGNKRPAYGYTNIPYVQKYDLGLEEGISIVDIESGKSKLIISFNDIAKALGKNQSDFSNNYLNHLSFSPDESKFLFFWLEKESDWHRANLLVYDFNTEKLIVLEKERKVSHYTWKGSDSIICTSINNDIKNPDPKYIEYDMLGNKKVLWAELLTKDGHPTLYNNNWMMTDTYPNGRCFQKLFFINLDSGETKEIAEIFHKDMTKSDRIERRTDLHPRFNINKDKICIDLNPNGKRSIAIFDLK